MANSKKNKGFTLVEILVVIGILTLLSATLILYSHTGERQITLFKEQARVISAIYRAKSLAMAAFGQTGTGVPCGYGVHFEAPGTFLIFEDVAVDCQSADHRYSGGSTSTETFEALQLEPTVRFSQLDLTDIVFVPPEPSVFITPAQDLATIKIEIIATGDSAAIKINSAGQISR